MNRFSKFALLLTIAAVLGAASFSSAWPIPDTGQTKCYNNTTEIPCPQEGEDFYGQDGNYLINAPSYTKLDENGNELPDDASHWVMVRDNVTGLTWEVKNAKDGVANYHNPHDADNVYTWYDPDPLTNWGDPGTPGEGTDTYDFIEMLNNSQFGGYSDWRMPNGKELRLIVDYQQQNPAINTTYFPNTSSGGYWSATIREYVSITYNYTPWVVEFFYGGDSHEDKYSSCFVRAVRGVQSGSLVDLVMNDNGTVTDTTTGLMWQQDTKSNLISWEAALEYCENLDIDGYTDWRLPNIKELQSLFDFNRCDQPSSTYWSSTTNAQNAADVWTDSGWDIEPTKDIPRYSAKGVRGGQTDVSDHLKIISPPQGSMWAIGDSMPLTWKTKGIEGNVLTAVSRQGGKGGTFETIDKATANDGFYSWVIGGQASVNCVLKIIPLNDTSKATTLGLFSIYAPDIPLAPKARTGSATFLSSTSVTLHGAINPNNASTSVVFEWGTDDNYGNEVKAIQSPLAGNNTKSVTAELSDLTPGLTYHFRTKATNIARTNYGDDRTFPPYSPNSTIYVPGDYTTIQAGIEAAFNGDTVVIEDGTYTGSANRRLDFKGKAITVKSENGPENCIIDCARCDRGFYFHSAEKEDSVLSGIKVINGKTAGVDFEDDRGAGGGIYCTRSSPTIIDCILRENWAEGSGGGIFCISSSPMIRNCKIINNQVGFEWSPGTPSGFGGGIYCGSSSPKIINCIIDGNTASTIRECAFGGGILIGSSSQPVITHCTIINNKAKAAYNGETDGGGIWCSSSSPNITNSIIRGNRETDGYMNYDAEDNLYCSSAAVRFSNIGGGFTGQGNIDVDPLFVGNGDYHLKLTSPCIDTGTANGAPDTDIEGTPRPQGSGFDMGAYEKVVYPCPECAVDPVKLEGITFESGTECECAASTSITIGPNVTIENGAIMLFKSPEISVKSGVDIEQGALVKMKKE